MSAIPADGTEVRLKRGMPGTYEGQPATVRHQSPSGHSNLRGPRPLVWLECEVIWSHGTAQGFWSGPGGYFIPPAEDAEPSREQRVEAAEDRAEQAAYDAAREQT